MDKIIYKILTLNCTPEYAFRLFTENELLQLWLTAKADVEPVLGGRYELFWNPEDPENDSTKGCRITGITRNKLLSFEWKGPKEFKHFMNESDPLTHVIVFFIPSSSKRTGECTEIHLLHTGWRSSKDWEEARLWFDRAWTLAFDKLTEITNRTKSKEKK